MAAKMQGICKIFTNIVGMAGNYRFPLELYLFIKKYNSRGNL